MLTVGSLFSGIGGGDLAAERAGMDVRWQCEIATFPTRVLERHWPRVRRYPDITTLDPKELEPVDVIVAGWPCQDLSIAGKRAGIHGARSGLFFDLCRVLAGCRPRFAVLENVAGLLGKPRGNFAHVLAALAEAGAMDVCWRVLDARWFGLAQKRAHPYLVVDFAGERAEQVLFEPEGCGWDSAPGGEAGARVAASLTAGSHGPGVNAAGRRAEDDVNLVVAQPLQANRDSGWRGNAEETFVLAGALCASDGGADDNDASRLIVANGLTGRYGKGTDSDATDTPVYQCHGNNVGPMGALRAGNGSLTGGVPFVLPDPRRHDDRHRGEMRELPSLHATNNDLLAHALTANGCDASEDGTGRGTPLATVPLGVRRLTPVGCERLQGFPDGWTAVDGDRTPDTPRYTALGNAMPVPVVEWIMRRIVAADRAAHEAAVVAEARRDVAERPEFVIEQIVAMGRRAAQ